MTDIERLANFFVESLSLRLEDVGSVGNLDHIIDLAKEIRQRLGLDPDTGMSNEPDMGMGAGGPPGPAGLGGPQGAVGPGGVPPTEPGIEPGQLGMYGDQEPGPRDLDTGAPAPSGAEPPGYRGTTIGRGKMDPFGGMTTPKDVGSSKKRDTDLPRIKPAPLKFKSTKFPNHRDVY